MKRTFSILLTLLMLFGCACAESLQVAALKGPTAMGMVKMMADDSIDAEYAICAAADEITPRLVRGELDVAALPANLAAILYQKTSGAIQVLAVNTLGVLYIAERGDSIHTVADLKGKTLYTAGKASTPEFALSYILRMNDLEPGTDVQIEFRSEHAECLSALMNDASAAAMLPQPFMTTAMTKASDMRVALDLTAEWDKLDNGSGMITGVVVGRREFIDANPKAVSDFLAAYRASVEYVNANPADAAKLIESYGIVSAAVAEKALPYCNICLIEGAEMHAKLEGYLRVLHEQERESVGGALPDAQFYFKAEG